MTSLENIKGEYQEKIKVLVINELSDTRQKYENQIKALDIKINQEEYYHNLLTKLTNNLKKESESLLGHNHNQKSCNPFIYPSFYNFNSFDKQIINNYYQNNKNILDLGCLKLLKFKYKINYIKDLEVYQLDQKDYNKKRILFEQNIKKFQEKKKELIKKLLINRCKTVHLLKSKKINLNFITRFIDNKQFLSDYKESFFFDDSEINQIIQNIKSLDTNLDLLKKELEIFIKNQNLNQNKQLYNYNNRNNTNNNNNNNYLNQKGYSKIIINKRALYQTFEGKINSSFKRRYLEEIKEIEQNIELFKTDKSKIKQELNLVIRKQNKTDINIIELRLNRYYNPRIKQLKKKLIIKNK